MPLYNPSSSSSTILSGVFITKYVTWAGRVNVTEYPGSRLVKTSGSGGQWDAGAYSVEQISSGYVKIEAIVSAGNEVRMIGVSNVTQAQADSGSSTLDYAIYPFSDSNLYRQINGVSGSLGVGYQIGDIVGLEITALGNVNWLKNGIIVYQQTNQTILYPVCVDCSFESTGSSLSECKITTISQ